MGKNSQRTEEIELLCRLTESELEEEAKKLTALIVEKSQQEAEKKAMAADYGDRIKRLEEEIEDQVPIVADRQKRKMVSCLIEYNKPSLGKKTVTRLDLNTVVGVYDMNEDEKQDIFYNSDEEEDAIDVPAVKLLPAAEDTAEVKPGNLLPAAADDTEPIIHVEKPEPGKVCQVNLEVGKLYEVEGVVCRCDRETDGQCDGCMLQDKEDLCYEYKFACDGVILKPGIVRPSNAEPNETEAPAAPEDEQDAAEMHTCEDCGMVPATGFVWLLNKWLCKSCNDKRNKSKLDNLPPADDLNGLKFRAYHYKGVTNFKFILHGKASWGNPINLFGDYSDPNTESDALEFYHHLKSKGCVEA